LSWRNARRNERDAEGERESAEMGGKKGERKKRGVRFSLSGQKKKKKKVVALMISLPAD